MLGGSQYSDPRLNPTDLAHMLRMRVASISVAHAKPANVTQLNPRLTRMSSIGDPVY